MPASSRRWIVAASAHRLLLSLRRRTHRRGRHTPHGLRGECVEPEPERDPAAELPVDGAPVLDGPRLDEVADVVAEMADDVVDEVRALGRAEHGDDEVPRLDEVVVV